ncbi:MAG: hypothetical protein ABIX01_07860 [Chitinophagaceae bacterium]
MDYGKLETINWILTIAFAVVVALFAWYLLKSRDRAEKQEASGENMGTKETRQLQLGAYERLALLAERTKLEGLITSLNQSGYSAKDMQQAIIHTIRQEYAHNITQQIYVSAGVWSAIEKMKDQNMYIVSQLAATLPQTANAMDLNKAVLQFTMNNPEATMNKLVQEAIQFEAKKLL